MYLIKLKQKDKGSGALLNKIIKNKNGFFFGKKPLVFVISNHILTIRHIFPKVADPLKILKPFF